MIVDTLMNAHDLLVSDSRSLFGVRDRLAEPMSAIDDVG